ncbi:hypothetical protein BDZ89DRAFT_1045991 [Hymenopellis radicata]|nr:hypothetical protein BDZ89DRAFT_1045991 [Hymenopellis radicata]
MTSLFPFLCEFTSLLGFTMISHRLPRSKPCVRSHQCLGKQATECTRLDWAVAQGESFAIRCTGNLLKSQRSKGLRTRGSKHTIDGNCSICTGEMNVIRDSPQCGGPYVQEQCNGRLMFSKRSSLRADERERNKEDKKQNKGRESTESVPVAPLSLPNVTLTLATNKAWTEFESFRWQSAEWGAGSTEHD